MAVVFLLGGLTVLLLLELVSRRRARLLEQYRVRVRAVRVSRHVR
jgi:hypothetical protein